MSCAIFDINGDNLNDIFITNDFQKNELFIQTENRDFKKSTNTPIIKQITTGASLNVLDFNNDSRFDIFISSLNNLNQQISNGFPNSQMTPNIRQLFNRKSFKWAAVFY